MKKEELVEIFSNLHPEDSTGQMIGEVPPCQWPSYQNRFTKSGYGWWKNYSFRR